MQLWPGIFTKSVCFYVEISQSQSNLSLGRSWGVLGETWGLPGSIGQSLKADFVVILCGCATWGFIGLALESRFCRYFAWVRHLGLHWASFGKQILSLFCVGAPLEAFLDESPGYLGIGLARIIYASSCSKHGFVACLRRSCTHKNV